MVLMGQTVKIPVITVKRQNVTSSMVLVQMDVLLDGRVPSVK
ncbi:hypothetical protein AM593_06849, partial [Mytilus galloprovincialis]